MNTIKTNMVSPSDEVARLKRVIAHAESEHGKRFALVDLGEGQLLITTSNCGDAPTPFELRILAAFARPWADAQVAYALGYARALTETYPDASARPEEAEVRLEEACARASHAAFTSGDLTNAALVPFGLTVRAGDEGPIWTRDERDPLTEVAHAHQEWGVNESAIAALEPALRELDRTDKVDVGFVRQQVTRALDALREPPAPKPGELMEGGRMLHESAAEREVTELRAKLARVRALCTGWHRRDLARDVLAIIDEGSEG